MKKNFRRILSIMLCVVFTLTAIPFASISIRADAFGSYSKARSVEYHYDAGTVFIRSLAAGYDGSKLSTVKNQMSERGYTCLDWDFASGTKNGKYIGIGYNTTTDPTQAITAPRFYSAGSSHDNSSITSAINGINAVFYKVNISPEPTYFDGNVDFLNGVSKANYEYLYVTRDYYAGPAITSVMGADSEANIKNAGYTPVDSFQRMGQGWDTTISAGGNDRFFGYKSTCTTVNSDALRSTYSNGILYYNNSSRYVSVSTLSSALSTAESILSDLNDGYTTYTQTDINNAVNAINNALNALQTSVTLNPNGGSGGGTDIITVGTATSKTYTTSLTASRTGYTFHGWSSSSSAASGSTSLQACFKPTYYAAWTINTSTLKVDPNGGSWNGSSSVQSFTQDYNTTKTVSTPSRTGYTFNGWSFDGSNGSLSGATYKYGAVNGAVDKITANWTVNQYNVSWETDGNPLTGDYTHGSTNYGTTIVAPDTPTKTGYTFKGWSPSVDTTVPAKDVTYTATWEINKYTVTYKNEDGTVLESKSWNYGTTPSYSGATPTKACDDNYHYTFAGWTPSETTVTGDITYTAKYTATAHTLNWMNTSADKHHQFCTGCDYVTGDASHKLETKTDSQYHWNYCPTCGYTSQKIAHTLTLKTYATKHRYECSCGYFEGETAHTLSVKSDVNGHWYESDDGCGYKTEVSRHTSTQKINAEQHYLYCSECHLSYNYENHNLVLKENEWDEFTHTYVCDKCPQEVKEEHLFTDASGKCRTCGYSQNDMANYEPVLEALEKVPDEKEVNLFIVEDENYEHLQIVVASIKWNYKSAQQTIVNDFAETIEDAVDNLTIKVYPVNNLPSDCTLEYKKTTATNHYMVATVKAPIQNSAKQYFSYWVDENGNVVSTYLNYSFYSVAERSLTPVYGETLTADDYISSKVAGVRDNLDGTYTILVEHSASQKVTINGHGVLFTYDGNKTGNLVLDSNDDDIYNPVAAATASTRTGLFEVKIEPQGADNIFVKPYVINSSGETVYGEDASFALDSALTSQSVNVLSVTEITLDEESEEPATDETTATDESVQPDYQLTIWEKIVAFILGIWKYIMSIFSF